MLELNRVTENHMIENITRYYHRSPLQMNKLHESDSEILNINYKDDEYLVITTDSIVEEIEFGIYKDPYLIGWMIVMVNMSDLAAVGAIPIGILISEVLSGNLDEAYLMNLHKGINDACEKCNTYVIGGDTNFGKQLILTGTALGKVKNRIPLTRVGCNPGDLIYSTGKLGIGNAFALSQLVGTNHKTDFMPVAKLKIAKFISSIANSCIDTSDGVIASLDQLMRLNNVGIHLDPNICTKLDTKSKSIMFELNLPKWLLLAGQHGEFELIFTVPPKLVESLNKLASKYLFNVFRIGKVRKQKGLFFNFHNRLVEIPTTKIRNLTDSSNFDLNQYLKALLEIDTTLK